MSSAAPRPIQRLSRGLNLLFLVAGFALVTGITVGGLHAFVHAYLPTCTGQYQAMWCTGIPIIGGVFTAMLAMFALTPILNLE